MGSAPGTGTIARRFLILVHRVPVDADFTLNDLAGTGGRMDAIAGSVTAAFLISNGMRRDTELSLLILSDPSRILYVRLDSRRLRSLNPDERSTAALIKNAIVRYWGSQERRDVEFDPHTEIETAPGICVRMGDLESDLRSYAGSGRCIWLNEEGDREAITMGEGGLSVILSDPYEPSEEEVRQLKGLGLKKVSVGPLSLHTSQCITIVHNALDTAKLYQNTNPDTPR